MSREENPETAVGTAGEIVDVSKTADNVSALLYAATNTADAATTDAATAAALNTAQYSVDTSAATK
jgi:hypothetical protein